MSSPSVRHKRFKGLPLILMVSISLVLASGLFWISRVSTASANFPDFQLVEAAYPGVVGSRIDSCSFCHTSAPNLNAYGSAYKAKGRGSATSLTSIEGVDSDGDGFTNIQEILALTFPGDKLDFPVVASPTATKVPPTATTVPPTATKVPPTATKAPPTATSVGPTATKAPATATSVGPTATKLPATATSVGPTATKLPATATKQTGPTSTKLAATSTKITKVTRTPGPRPTPVVQCVKDDKHDDEDDRSQSGNTDSADHRRNNPCPPGYHPRESDWEHKKGKDFFNWTLDQISSWFKGNK